MEVLRKTEVYIYADRDLLVHNLEEINIGGLFEIDIIGNLMPVIEAQMDDYFELDVNDNIMPLTV